MNTTRTLIRRKSEEKPADWDSRLMALLKELPGLPDTCEFRGSVNRGGLAAFAFEVRIK